ncbi:hydroxysqualene dehydroxylase HpnE [Azospirillum sp. SYSU D00513]|uniref:hydroxysqualene dehydroxylase HpnE n=1 Tax=Azospirillum sp. SYSU D00513 TaxID=2812561 RepID=UPI001A95F186|nr:hydroxysqualene dehydroxylase HpnE [Azospirillum sp. SYSU D00513]
MTTIHIVGAGLAGLAAAVRLQAGGRAVALYESALQAGGRCRSFHDSTLGRTLDNGSHLVLSGNRALLGYADRIGGLGRLEEIRPAAFPFLDLRDGREWCLRPGGLWLVDPARRVPGSRPADYLRALKAVFARPNATVAEVLSRDGALYERLWKPLVVSALNGDPSRVSARLFGAVLRETLLRGESSCRPVIARDGLSAAFVEPALRRLEESGAPIRLGTRVDGLTVEGGRVRSLSAGGSPVPVTDGDTVLLALPPWAAERLLPGLTVPNAGEAIVNAHFRLDRPAALKGGLPFLGLIGGTAEWLFARGDMVSVTVSAADALADRPAEEVAGILWRDVARALGTADAIPSYRIIKEKRATFDQSPAEAARRPGPVTALPNLFLAGDWTDTGLPATLEGAVRSGERAAAAILAGNQAGRRAAPTRRASDSRTL